MAQLNYVIFLLFIIVNKNIYYNPSLYVDLIKLVFMEQPLGYVSLRGSLPKFSSPRGLFIISNKVQGLDLRN